MALRMSKEHQGSLMEFLASEAVVGLGAFADQLLNMDFGPVFDGLVDPVNESFGSNFDRKTGPDGQPWKPHAAYTIKKMGVHPLLMWTGAMIFSLESRSGSGRIEEITSNSLTIGTDLFYAGWQQYGTAKIPARPFVWMLGSDIDQITQLFADRVLEQLST